MAPTPTPSGRSRPSASAAAATDGSSCSLSSASIDSVQTFHHVLADRLLERRQRHRATFSFSACVPGADGRRSSPASRRRSRAPARCPSAAPGRSPAHARGDWPRDSQGRHGLVRRPRFAIRRPTGDTHALTSTSSVSFLSCAIASPCVGVSMTAADQDVAPAVGRRLEDGQHPQHALAPGRARPQRVDERRKERAVLRPRQRRQRRPAPRRGAGALRVHELRVTVAEVVVEDGRQQDRRRRVADQAFGRDEPDPGIRVAERALASRRQLGRRDAHRLQRARGGHGHGRHVVQPRAQRVLGRSGDLVLPPKRAAAFSRTSASGSSSAS